MIVIVPPAGMPLVNLEAMIAPATPAAAVALMALWMCVVQVLPPAESEQVNVGVVAERLSAADELA